MLLLLLLDLLILGLIGEVMFDNFDTGLFTNGLQSGDIRISNDSFVLTILQSKFLSLGVFAFFVKIKRSNKVGRK